MGNVKITEKVIVDALDWAYDKAVNGVPGMLTAKQLADDFLKAEHKENISEEETPELFINDGISSDDLVIVKPKK